MARHQKRSTHKKTPRTELQGGLTVTIACLLAFGVPIAIIGAIMVVLDSGRLVYVNYAAFDINLYRDLKEKMITYGHRPLGNIGRSYGRNSMGLVGRCSPVGGGHYTTL